MDNAIGRRLRARVPGMVNGALFGALVAVVAGLSWANPQPYDHHAVIWPYPNIMGLTPSQIWRSGLGYGLAITACGALLGLLIPPPQEPITTTLGRQEIFKRLAAVIRYVTRPRITFLD